MDEAFLVYKLNDLTYQKKNEYNGICLDIEY